MQKASIHPGANEENRWRVEGRVARLREKCREAGRYRECIGIWFACYVVFLDTIYGTLPSAVELLVDVFHILLGGTFQTHDKR